MSPPREVLLLRGYRGRIAVLPTEVTLDGLDLVTFEPQILHVPERLTVRGVTEIHHKRLIARSSHVLQVEPPDEGSLCVPASCLESALTDVGVDRACKCEVVGQQHVERAPILDLPALIVFPDSRFVSRTQRRLRTRIANLRNGRRRSQRAATRSEQGSARHCCLSHDAFLLCFARPSGSSGRSSPVMNSNSI